ncbi:hypothetical protein R1sor_009548 [Riccia sorocarpa]|uniref:Uncharacterized protein n=1 Tax=Riccia sorocarpa TaxID=122646 RepID=A0ABD3HZ03_9MARC
METHVTVFTEQRKSLKELKQAALMMKLSPPAKEACRYEKKQSKGKGPCRKGTKPPTAKPMTTRRMHAKRMEVSVTIGKIAADVDVPVFYRFALYAEEHANRRAKRLWSMAVIPTTCTMPEIDHVFFNVEQPGRYFNSAWPGELMINEQTIKNTVNETAEVIDVDLMGTLDTADLEILLDTGYTIARKSKWTSGATVTKKAMTALEPNEPDAQPGNLPEYYLALQSFQFTRPESRIYVAHVCYGWHVLVFVLIS